MQALIHHFAPKQIHEDAHAAEKDRDAEIEELENSCEDLHVIPQLILLVADQPVPHHRDCGAKGQQIDPKPAFGEEGAA